MFENQHIYQFEVKLAVGGCGTTSYANVKKTVMAENETIARAKLMNDICIDNVHITGVKKHPHIK